MVSRDSLYFWQQEQLKEAAPFLLYNLSLSFWTGAFEMDIGFTQVCLHSWCDTHRWWPCAWCVKSYCKQSGTGRKSVQTILDWYPSKKLAAIFDHVMQIFSLQSNVLNGNKSKKRTEIHPKKDWNSSKKRTELHPNYGLKGVHTMNLPCLWAIFNRVFQKNMQWILWFLNVWSEIKSICVRQCLAEVH